MKYFCTLILLMSISSAFAQEALIDQSAPTPNTMTGITSNGGSEQKNIESPTTEQLDVLQFPTGSIISKGDKIGEFQTWVLASALNPETMEAIFDSQSTTSKALSELEMTERTDMARFNAAVVTTGFNYVNYNLENGPISKGDFITISSEDGVGAKAIEDCFTVGIALEGSESTEKDGLIKIKLMFRYEKM